MHLTNMYVSQQRVCVRTPHSWGRGFHLSTAHPCAPLLQLTRTVCDQGHLCPLPLATQPIHWDLDFALRLYPLPDVVGCRSYLLLALCACTLH